MLNGNTKHYLKMGYGEIYHANTNEKKTGVGVFFSDEAAFRTRKIISDKVEYYILIYGNFSKKMWQSIMCLHPMTIHQNVR